MRHSYGETSQQSRTRRGIVIAAVLALLAGLIQAVAGPVSPASAAPLPAGEQWESQETPDSRSWFAVTWGDGKFVAVAGGGAGKRAMTSPDGKTWTEATGDVPVAEWIGITYGNGKFVAVAKTTPGDPLQKVMTSTDGNNWEFQEAASANQWLAVAFGGGTYVAVAGTGNQDRVMTSTDGENWVTRATHENSDVQWNGVTYTSNRFVAVSSSGKAMRSGDQEGTIWSNSPSALGNPSNDWLSVAYGADKLVAVAFQGPGDRIATSTNGGLGWVAQPAPEDNQWWSITYGGNEGDKKFVAVAINGDNPIMTSPTGESGTWTAHPGPAGTSGDDFRSVAWGATPGPGGDTLVAVSATGVSDKRAMSSPLTSPEIGEVEITGDPEVGSELSVNEYTVTGSKPLTTSHRWQRSDTGTDGWANVGDVDDDTYTVVEGDKNKHFRVRVTASNAADEIHRNSNVIAIQAAPFIEAVNISGEGYTAVGETLEADTVVTGTPTPEVTWQWQRSPEADENGPWENIADPSDSNEYVLQAEDNGQFIRVIARASNGVGSPVELPSWPAGPVGIAPTIDSVSIEGSNTVGSSLTAAAQGVNGTPVVNTTYKWQRSDTEEGTYTDIGGATSASYELAPADAGKYVRAQARAQNGYGSATSNSTPRQINQAPDFASAAINGTLLVGQEQEVQITGQVGFPDWAPDYQWQRSNTNSGNDEDWTDIEGATYSTYTYQGADGGKFIRVKVSGDNGIDPPVTKFTSVVGPVEQAPSIGSVEVTGVAKPGSQITATAEDVVGTPTPTVSIQWYVANSPSGPWVQKVPGPPDASYTPTLDDVGKYLRATAETNNNGHGIATKDSEVIPVVQSPSIASVSVSGVRAVGQALTATPGTLGGTPLPSVTYQWQRTDEENPAPEDWVNIEGEEAQNPAYFLTEDDVDHWVRVVATATNGVDPTASVESAQGDQIGKLPVIDYVDLVSDDDVFKVGQEITAFTVMSEPGKPTADDFTYQWMISNYAGTEWSAIGGATNATYTPVGGVAGDQGKRIKVVVTATNDHGSSASVESDPEDVNQAPDFDAPVISGTLEVGSELSVQDLHPAGVPTAVTMTYQWQRANAADAPEGQWQNIGDPVVDGNTYTLDADDAGKFLRVRVTGSNGIEPNAVKTSAVTGVVNQGASVTDVSISGTPKVGEQLTAQATIVGFPAPTVTYAWQWSVSGDPESTWTPIGMSNNVNYTPPAPLAGRYLRVVVQVLNDYGAAGENSAPVQIQQAPEITSVAVLGDPMVGASLTVDVVATGFPLPVEENIAYQWQIAENSVLGPWADIPEATNKSYLLGQEEAGKFLQVVVTVNNGVSPEAVETSNETAQIGQLPSVGSVTVEGDGAVGETLKAEWHDPAGFPFPTFEYKWQRSANGTSGWANISGVADDGDEYVVTGADEGQYVRAVVIATNSHGFSQTESGGVEINTEPTIGGVAVTGVAQVGQQLTATAQDVDGGENPTVTYRWERSDIGADAWAAIGTGANYTLTTADQAKYVRAVATVKNAAGEAEAESAAVGPIAAAPVPPPPPPPVIVKPNAPRTLKVAGKRTARTFTARWKVPTGTNSTTRPVSSYRVELVVRGKKKVLTARNLNARTFRYVMKKATLTKLLRKNKVKNARSYRFTIRVYARNSAGRSVAARSFVMNR